MQAPLGHTAQGGLEPEELAALRESVVIALSKECDSLAVHAHIDSRRDLSLELWQQAAELGWLGIALPEDRGGLGLGASGIALLCRELGAFAAPGPFIPALCGLTWLSETRVADADAIIDRVVAGEISLAIPTRADAVLLRLDASGLTGAAELLAGGRDPVAIVPAAGAWAIVDLAHARLSTRDTWDRTRTVVTAEFESAPIIAQVADPGGTASQLLGTLVAIALTADSVGAAEAITYKTIAYMKERVQFERTIASFQAIKHRAADLVSLIATQEHLLQQAVESQDFGMVDAGMWARLAKAGACEAAAFITGDCITLHGGVGHTWEYDPHIYAKRARLNQFLLADNGQLRSEAVSSLAAAVTVGRAVTEILA